MDKFDETLPWRASSALSPDIRSMIMRNAEAFVVPTFQTLAIAASSTIHY